MPSMRRAFNMSVWYLLCSIEMVKDIDVLWDVIFVICMIYESMRGMEVKDSKIWDYNCWKSCKGCFPRGNIL